MNDKEPIKVLPWGTPYNINFTSYAAALILQPNKSNQYIHILVGLNQYTALTFENIVDPTPEFSRIFPCSLNTLNSKF